MNMNFPFNFNRRKPQMLFAQLALVSLSFSVVAVLAEEPEGYPGTTELEMFQQTGTLRGTVRDNAGMVLSGATVRVLELGRTVGTNINGEYQVDLPVGQYTVEASYISYAPRQQTLNIRDTAPVLLDFELEPEESLLAEVVVVGYGTNTRRSLSTAVASVNTDQIAQRNIGSSNQLLQGQVAGVNLTVNNGTPGAKSRVSIRGVSSINGDNEPLYVIDGVILSKSTASYNYSGEYQQDPLSLINPNDIATIDVLKDAAATAIYGSRGTNGVIIITTKQGRAGQTRVSLSHQSGIGIMPKKLDLLNSDDYIAMQQEAVSNFNQDNGYQAGDAGFVNINNVLGVVPADRQDINWQDLIIRDQAVNTQTDLSFSGGNEKTTHFTSFGYNYQEGMIKKSALSRYSVRSNIDYKPNSFLNVGMRLSGNVTDSESIPNGDQGTALFQRSLEQRPYDSPFLADGSFAVGGLDILRHNALIILDKDDTNDKNYQGLANLYANINFLKWFTFHSSYNAEMRLGHGHRVQRIGHPYNGSKGWINDVRNYRYSGTFDNTLTFSKRWDNSLQTELMAGHSFFRDSYNFNEATGTEFPSDDFKHITAATIKVGNENASYYNIESYISRLNVSYKDRYFLMLSARNDGSSKFAEANRYAIFPAASFGWVVSDEDFINRPSWLSFAKLRLSWGKTGNQDGIGNYAYFPTASGGYNYDLGTGLSVTSLGNTDLVWEVSTQTNAGVDLSFLGNRLSLTYDYFHKISDDLLYDVPVLATSGFNIRTSNIGNMENKGHEIALTSHNIKREKFNWHTNFNVSFVKSKVTSLVGDAPIIFGGWHAIIEGQPLGTLFNYKMEGIYQTLDEIPAPLQAQGVRPGDIRFADLDGNGIINSADQTIIGQALPIFTGGMTNSFEYGNFDLSLFTTFSYGNDIAAAWRTGLDHLGGRDYGALATSYRNRWTGAGSTNETPRATKSAFNIRNSSYYVEDGSYLRLKSLTLGYRLPGQVINRLGVSGGARIFFTGVNLLTFTNYSGYDPEAASGSDARSFGIDNLVTPQPRSFMMGININF